jgi:hypothetical protein
MTATKSSTREQELSRREVLKALAAIGGAAAASSFLPEKWVKPVVETGVLPAHAQSSVCSPPFTFDQCADGFAGWSTTPSPIPTLLIDSMAFINTRCEGLPLLFTFIIKNNEGKIIYSSNPDVYLTNNHGFAEAIVFVPSSQIAGVPYLVSFNWEFINNKYGNTHCTWEVGITQR